MKTPGLNYNEEAKKQLLDADWLKEKYVGELMPVCKIANLLGCHDLTVKAALIKFNIPVRSVSESLKLVKRTPQWRKNLSKSRIEKGVAKGDKNPNWQGGKTAIQYKIRPQLWESKQRVKQRDGYRCVMCGVEEHQCTKCNQIIQLHVDHIIPFSADDSLRFSEENMQTLCTSCHKKKSAKDRMDIRANGVNSAKNQTGQRRASRRDCA